MSKIIRVDVTKTVSTSVYLRVDDHIDIREITRQGRWREATINACDLFADEWDWEVDEFDVTGASECREGTAPQEEIYDITI